jgi:hypothetical protein
MTDENIAKARAEIMPNDVSEMAASHRRAFDAGVNLLKAENEKYCDEIAQLKVQVEELKWEIAGTNLDIEFSVAKGKEMARLTQQEALNKLKRLGILNENGSISENYGGESSVEELKAVLDDALTCLQFEYQPYSIPVGPHMRAGERIKPYLEAWRKKHIIIDEDKA